MQLSKPEVLITKKFPDEIVRPLKTVAYVHQWDQHTYDLMPRVEVMKVIGKMSAIINQAELNVDKEVLMKGKLLKIIANVSLGYDNLNLELMTKHGVWASNTPGFFDYPVIEYVVGGMIIILRRLLAADRFVKNGEWHSFQPGRWDGEVISNKTLGIIGMGNIGKSLADKAACLGMRVIYYGRSKNTSSHQWLPLNDLLSQADVISVHVPYTNDTHEMIDAAKFKKMKSGALFVNTSRGKVVNESDLIHFLSTGHLCGAVLDVFADEPLIPDILKTMPNVLLTPHIAGGTVSSRVECYRLAVDNILEVLKGRQPINPLNNIVEK